SGDPRRLFGDPGRLAGGRRRNRLRQLQSLASRLGAAPGAGAKPRSRHGGAPVKVSGEKSFGAPRPVVWEVLNDPARMAKLMPGIESFEVADERHWSAKVKVPLGLGALPLSFAFE